MKNFRPLAVARNDLKLRLLRIPFNYRSFKNKIMKTIMLTVKKVMLPQQPKISGVSSTTFLTFHSLDVLVG